MKLDTETKKEYWVEIFKNRIPTDSYKLSFELTDVEFGEKIYLRGQNNILFFQWKVQFEVRSISRKLSWEKLFPKEMISKFQKGHFQNIIYEVKNSELIKDFEYRGFEENGSTKLKHYLIIASNLVVDILALDDISLHFEKIDGEILESELVVSTGIFEIEGGSNGRMV